MAEKAINPIGIKLNIDGIRDIKKALNQWKKQMEICFTLSPEWNTDSCHSIAELSIEGSVHHYIKFLIKETTPEHKNLLEIFQRD